MALPKYALIVAGGRGTRMQLSTPKQFVPIGGKPMLMRTLEAFHRCLSPIHIIAVLPETEIATWKALCHQHTFSVPHQLVTGGATRSASVYQGMQHIDDHNSLVAVHDGVRPLVTPQLIEEAYRQAECYGSAIASVPLKDSIRKMEGERSKACLRDQYRLIQTPQTFRTEVLWKAYARLGEEVFSDDASLVEHSGHPIHLIEGEYRNLKVTTPEDLIVAEAYWDKASTHDV